MFWNKQCKSNQKTEYDRQAAKLQDDVAKIHRALLLELREYMSYKYFSNMFDKEMNVNNHKIEIDNKCKDHQHKLSLVMDSYEKARVRFNMYWHNNKQNMQYYTFQSIKATAVEVCKDYIMRTQFPKS